MQRAYRVVVAGVGPDGDRRAVVALARSLRDAGFEVIDAGVRQAVEQVAATALQEDADAVGVVAAGGPSPSVPAVVEALAERGLDDVVAFDGAPPDAGAGAVTRWLAGALDARDAASVE